jgi:hypothetical protein
MIEKYGGDDGARTRDLRRDRSALCTRAPVNGFCRDSSTPIESGISSRLCLGVRRSMPPF